jgi:hypothetical protein
MHANVMFAFSLLLPFFPVPWLGPKRIDRVRVFCFLPPCPLKIRRSPAQSMVGCQAECDSQPAVFGVYFFSREVTIDCALTVLAGQYQLPVQGREDTLLLMKGQKSIAHHDFITGDGMSLTWGRMRCAYKSLFGTNIASEIQS